ncbi:MAG: hypothetical protein JXR48_17835 [Candidatus Delongbacteria bacterium]|nr:hypothetical protein [Candidatus Delongbacteria bacterium]MBN2836820.1 hypothetical protein [Candidatus Delongbacteria bacterium]
MSKILLILLLTFSLFSEEIVKVVASGYGSDIEIARKTALRNAVEQVLGAKIESETYVQNYVTIRDNIYSGSEGFVKSYKILWTDRDNGGTIVTVEAEILKTTLLEKISQLGILLKQMDMPRILIVNTSDMTKLNKNYDKRCYRGIVNVLTNQGYFVLDKSTLEEFFKEQKAVAYEELNNRIADFGLKVNADYIVEYDIYEEDGILFIDSEVISTSTGKIIVSTSLDTKGKKISIKNAQDLGENLGGVLFSKIKASWEVRVQDGKYFTLVIEGYNSYSKFLEFLEKLKQMDYVSDVTEIESSNAKSTILFLFKGNRNVFKTQLFDKFKELNWSTRLIRSENSRMMVKVLK